MKLKEINSLKSISRISRIYSLMSIYFAGSGHPGGVLSSIDIINYIFSKKINFNKLSNYKVLNRNRFILSKGHSVPALYAVLSSLKLINFKNILNLRKTKSKFQGHPCRINTPWIEASTGSLGQGFSFSIGQAVATKYLKFNKKIFVMLGDGEMQEGQIWEGIMLASHLKLDNLVAILDYNKIQSDDFNKNIVNIEPLNEKIKSFGWNVLEINGHSFKEIDYAINKKFYNKKPLFIIANTIKGKGISFMENRPLWHGSVKMSINQIISSLKELRANEKFLNMCKKKI